MSNNRSFPLHTEFDVTHPVSGLGLIKQQCDADTSCVTSVWTGAGMGVDGFRHGSAARGPARLTVLTSFRERALSAASQAGLVNNLNDGLAWPGASFRSCSASIHRGVE